MLKIVGSFQKPCTEKCNEIEFEPRPLHLFVKRFFPQFQTSTPIIYMGEASQREEENYG